MIRGSSSAWRRLSGGGNAGRREWFCRVALTAFGVSGFGAVLCGAEPPSPVQSVRFSVFSVKPIQDVAFVPRANATSIPLVFHPSARSPRYEYRGAMPLRFLDAKTGVVVAEAMIPAQIREALLLFSPLEQKAGTGRFQIAVLDDSALRHGPGGLAILNLSGLSLTGRINGESHALKAGLNPTVAVGRAAKVTLTTVFKGRTYQAYSSGVSLGRNERALLILFPPFYAGSLEVQSRLLVDQPLAAASPPR